MLLPACEGQDVAWLLDRPRMKQQLVECQGVRRSSATIQRTLSPGATAEDRLACHTTRRAISVPVVVERVRTLGIDLAAQAKQTAVCLLAWGEGQAAIETLALGVDDAAILELIRSEEPAKVAIDAPFGWPAPFVAAVSQHASGGEWQAHAPQSLRLRATDLHVIAKTRQQPLSVSADKIAVTAFRCAGLLSELTKAGFAIDRAGDGLVVEVYPAAALRQWRMDPRGYKSDKPERTSSTRRARRKSRRSPARVLGARWRSSAHSSSPVTTCSMPFSARWSAEPR